MDVNEEIVNKSALLSVLSICSWWHGWLRAIVWPQTQKHGRQLLSGERVCIDAGRTNAPADSLLDCIHLQIVNLYFPPTLQSNTNHLSLPRHFCRHLTLALPHHGRFFSDSTVYRFSCPTAHSKRRAALDSSNLIAARVCPAWSTASIWLRPRPRSEHR